MLCIVILESLIWNLSVFGIMSVMCFKLKYKLKQYKCGMMDKIKRLDYNKCDVQLSKLCRIIDSNVFIGDMW
jgi:hypothetical protein